MKLTIGAPTPKVPKEIDKKRAYRPRVKKDKPLVPCQEAMPFLECFSDKPNFKSAFSPRYLAIVFFRICSKCGIPSQSIVRRVDAYCREGGDDWTVTDFRWAQTCIAAIKEHPESALALAKQCVEEYGKK